MGLNERRKIQELGDVTFPGRAAGVAINPIVCGARWVLLSIVIAIAASRGVFPGAAAVGIVAGYFVCEMIAAGDWGLSIGRELFDRGGDAGLLTALL